MHRLACLLCLLALPLAAAPQAPGGAAAAPPANVAPASSEKSTPVVVEAIVARVNNKVVSTMDLARAKQQLTAELQGQNPPPAPAAAKQQQDDLLRDLIDQQLLLQRAADLGYGAETETIRRLDQIRKSMNLPSMEALQQAVQAQGQNYEDFKQSISDGILTRMVIEQDVAPRISIPPEEVRKYYQQHKKEFVTQSGVDLGEILISTKDQPASRMDYLKNLADQVQRRAAQGEDFAKLATRYSQGTTATSGGEIGFFKNSSLSPALAKVLAKVSEGSVTPVVKTPEGYLILKVNTIRHAGQETLAQAQGQIQQILYEQELQPELKHYLAKLRREAFIQVKPGYLDTGASASSGAINLERFERVLPQDLPKQVDKDKTSGSGIQP